MLDKEAKQRADDTGKVFRKMKEVLTQEEFGYFTENYDGNGDFKGCVPAYILICSFYWNETPQGARYWLEVSNRLADQHLTPKN